MGRGGKKVAVIGIDFLKAVIARTGQVNRIHRAEKNSMRQYPDSLTNEIEELRSHRKPLPDCVSFIKLEIFDHFPRLICSQIAFTKVTMNNRVKFNPRQFTGGEAG